MPRRKTFDAEAVPPVFWQREDVRRALGRREIGRLVGVYLAAFPDCTQTQLAILTQHDRSDISNFVRGTRSSRVTDIDVLSRIADGLAMPDTARALLGLAPVNCPTDAAGSASADLDEAGSTVVTGWYQPSSVNLTCRIAICGSRSAECDGDAIDDVVHSLSQLLMNRPCQVVHGPMGIGIEIMTYIADYYQPPALKTAVGVFGRANVVRDADVVLVVGGGLGTLDEVDLAICMGKRIIPYVASGGAARNAFERIAADFDLRTWIPAADFKALGTRLSGEEYVRVIEHFLTDSRSPRND
jgi:hypothetical protein